MSRLRDRQIKAIVLVTALCWAAGLLVALDSVDGFSRIFVEGGFLVAAQFIDYPVLFQTYDEYVEEWKAANPDQVSV